MSARLLALIATAPRWFLAAGAAALSLASHSAAYHLGASHEFRAGFTAGERAITDRHRAATHTRTARQLQDRLNAQNASSPSPDDGLRCGPSTRDCPE